MSSDTNVAPRPHQQNGHGQSGCAPSAAAPSRREEAYARALARLPRPGVGEGCHQRLLGVANLGVLAGLSDSRIEADLRSALPPGNRPVRQQEIRDAVRTARRDCALPWHVGPGPTGHGRLHTHAAVSFDPGQGVNALIEAGGGELHEMDVLDSLHTDHVRLTWPPGEDTVRLLELLYSPDDVLFIGEVHDAGPQHVRPVREWLDLFRTSRHRPAHIIPNPLTGRPGTKKDGGTSYRCDDCVAAFRYAVGEFDSISRPRQLAFWRATRLPIVALIDTGGKSIHAWIRVDSRDRDEWEDVVERQLFRERFGPMGIDAACKNESRTSRLPGVRRRETGRWQRLLYLNPEGGMP